MGEIKAGVTVMQDFCRAGSSVFQSYIDYLDRDEAQRNNAIETYNLYHAYMGNPEKTTGLFTADLDELDAGQKKDLKHVFDVAQENGSVMWQTVISFDNRWLEQNGLYDSQRNILDERKIKEVARMAVNRMLEKEGLGNAVWSAAIHYNTDNFHVHVATVEPYPMRELMMYQGNLEIRGKFKLKNIEACKSSVVNEIMQTREVNLLINRIIRQDIVKSKENHRLAEDPDIRKKFMELYNRLPNVAGNFRNYNNAAMNQCRPLIDEISKAYLEKYHKEEYTKFLDILKRQSDLYSQAYGRYDRSYEESKKADLMERLGNAILKEVKEYGRRINGKIDKEIGKREELPLQTSTKALPPVDQNRPKTQPEQQPEKRPEPYPRQTADQSAKRDLNPMPEETGKSSMEIENEDFFSLALEPEEKVYNETVMEELEEWEAYQNYFKEKPVPNTEQEEQGSAGTLTKTYKGWFGAYAELKKQLNPKEGKIDKEKIMKILSGGEKSGNPYILHLQGEMLQTGRILEIDPDGAEKCFSEALQIFMRDEPALTKEAAAQSGKPDAETFRTDLYIQYRIGKMFNRGWGTEQDCETAAKWYEKSGTDYARYSLGNLYFYGEGVEQDYGMALQLYESVGNNGFAYLKCAEMYAKGLGCTVSKEQSEDYEQKAFEMFQHAEEKQPDDLFEYQLGRMLYYGKGCEQDCSKGLTYLEMAAEKKNVDAMYLAGKIYIDEEITEKIPKAVEWLEELSEKGNHSRAQYALGRLYSNSEMEHYDLGKAVKYLEKAAAQENGYAQYHLGKLYTDKTLNIYDPEKGIEYLEAAKEQENEAAQYRLGKIYLDKQGEVYNPEKGISYMSDLAENGNMYAQTRLGCEYLKGENVRRDIGTAQEWFTKAAEQGDDFAKTMLNHINSDPPKRTRGSGGRARSELNKALYSLQRSMDEEHRQAYQALQIYEIEQEKELEQIEI